MYCEIPACTGPFKDVISEYVEHKRSLGYDYGRAILYRLREMDLFFKQNGAVKPEIPESMFELWAKKRENESAINHRRRICVLIAFSKFMVARGYPGIHIGELATAPGHERFVPYIFSESEIAAVFAVLKNRNATNPCDSEAATFSAMFCIFYGCGLRKTEVQKLKMGDVNIVTGNIRIANSKGRESRSVFASESVRLLLSEYCERFRLGCGDESYLFPAANGAMFKDGKLYGHYRRTLIEAGIKPRESGRLPRLHDIRHTFCVHALEAMSRKGFDLYTSLPLLVAYLGHRSITETEYYLRLVEENFTSITEASRRYAPTMFPKAGDWCGE
jgi:integrase